MRTFLLVMAVVGFGCGRVVVDELAPGDSVVESDTQAPDAPLPAGPTPGWYEVPVDPASANFGYSVLELLDGALLHGTLHLGAGAPAGTYEVVVFWENETLEQVVAAVQAAPADTWRTLAVRGRLAPPERALSPSTCPRGLKSTGLLFWRHRAQDTSEPEVVGTSALSLVGLSGVSPPVVYDACASGNRWLLSGDLRHEPRFGLAQCLARNWRCFDGDSVRVKGSTVTVDGDFVAIRTDFVFIDEGKQPQLEVNGQPVEATGRLPRSLFRPGHNRITWRAPDRKPWEATVVLPETELQPVVAEPLRLNRPFTTSWSADWATDVSFTFYPVDAPWTRAVYPTFSARTPPVTDVFPGFPDGRGGVVTGTRAQVWMTAVRADGAFSLVQNESIEVPIAP
jgi:hypothetical protein